MPLGSSRLSGIGAGVTRIGQHCPPSHNHQHLIHTRFKDCWESLPKFTSLFNYSGHLTPRPMHVFTSMATLCMKHCASGTRNGGKVSRTAVLDGAGGLGSQLVSLAVSALDVPVDAAARAAAAAARIPDPPAQPRKEKPKKVSWLPDDQLVLVRWFRQVCGPSCS